MSLRDWFRRHGNVFSISTEEVDADSADEDMLHEEYGDRAVEARRTSESLFGGLDVSEDGIQDAEPPPDPAH